MGVVRDMSEDVKSENNLQGGSANGLQSVHKVMLVIGPHPSIILIACRFAVICQDW